MSDIGPYYSWYNSRASESFPIQPLQVESGMLLDVFYASKHRPTDKSKISAARKYIILVLHPRWRGPDQTDYFLHGITLEYVKGIDFYKFTEDIGLMYATNFKKIKKLKVPKFDMKKEEAKKFYLTEVKIRMKNSPGYDKSYRTFDTNHFIRMKVVDFHFPIKILQKALIT